MVGTPEMLRTRWPPTRKRKNELTHSLSLFLSLSQANLKKFLEYIQHHQVDKVTKLLERGLDPNYHDSDTGGTSFISEKILFVGFIPILRSITRCKTICIFVLYTVYIPMMHHKDLMLVSSSVVFLFFCDFFLFFIVVFDYWYKVLGPHRLLLIYLIGS